MCPCVFWLQELLKMRNAPGTKACLWLLSLGHVCDLPWSSQRTCVVQSCLSPGQTGKAKPLDQRPGLLLGFGRGRLTSIAKEKTQAVKFWQKQLLITDVPFPSRQLGVTLWVLWRVTTFWNNISHCFCCSMGCRDVSAPISPCWAPHSSGCWALQQELAPCVQILELFTLEVCGSEPRSGLSCAPVVSVQNSRKCLYFKSFFFCQWLIPVHPCCHSRDTINVATNKRNLCTKTSGPAWVFVTDAMLSNYLVAYTNTFPAKPMKVTETNCCNVLPTATESQILVPWERQTPKDLDLMFDNIWAYSATKRKWDKLSTLEMPPDGLFETVSPTALSPDFCFTPSSVHLYKKHSQPSWGTGEEKLLI